MTEKKVPLPQCKEKPVHPLLLGFQKLKHFKTGIQAALNPAVLTFYYKLFPWAPQACRNPWECTHLIKLDKQYDLMTQFEFANYCQT